VQKWTKVDKKTGKPAGEKGKGTEKISANGLQPPSIPQPKFLATSMPNKCTYRKLYFSDKFTHCPGFVKISLHNQTRPISIYRTCIKTALKYDKYMNFATCNILRTLR